MRTTFIQFAGLPEMSRTPDVILRLFEKILYRPRPGRVVLFQVLENTSTSGIHTVNSDFFTSIGFIPMGGMARRYNTRKGKAARLLCEVLNIPPACFKTGKSHKGVTPMNTTTCAPAQSATPSTTTINGCCNTSNILFELWERTAHTLNKSELAWFAKASESAKQQAANMRDTVECIGCLIASDTESGALQSRESVSTMLFKLASQLDTINGLLEIGGAATDRLMNPEIYAMIGGEKP